MLYCALATSLTIMSLTPTCNLADGTYNTINIPPLDYHSGVW